MDHAQLRESRENRARIKQKYGGEIPTSIWKVRYADNTNIIDLTPSQESKAVERHAERALAGKYDETDQSHKGYPSLLKIREVSGKSIRGKEGGVSRYPASICRRLVIHFTEPGETVYDPCSGHNSRMQVVWELGRNYIGYDISQDYIDMNKEVMKQLLGQSAQSQTWLLGMEPQATVELYCRDNSQCHLKDSSIDFTFSSPPYWDLEYYGDEPEQLGWGKSYPEFLDGMQQMMSEQYRVLKPGRFCALSVNDFRKKGKYYSYHADIIRLGEAVGFEMFDLIIVEWHTCIRQAFASQIETTRIMPKKHEYIVVFRKPEGDF